MHLSKKQLPQLKDFFGTKYTLKYSENYQNFLRELGIKKNTRVKAITSKPMVVLAQENDEYILNTSYPEGRVIKRKFKIGEKIQRPKVKGRTACSVFNVVNNVLLEEQYVDDKKIMIEREFWKKKLFVTMEVNNVKCIRVYAESESSHSIETESSRRSSFWREKSPAEFSLSSVVETIYSEQEEETEDEDVCY